MTWASCWVKAARSGFFRIKYEFPMFVSSRGIISPTGSFRPSQFPRGPDLAIDVLSQGNTEAEMQRKLRDYFAAGVRLVWYIDPDTRSAKSYTAEAQCVEVAESQSLSGGDVLPDFELTLSELFAKSERTRNRLWSQMSLTIC